MKNRITVLTVAPAFGMSVALTGCADEDDDDCYYEGAGRTSDVSVMDGRSSGGSGGKGSGSSGSKDKQRGSGSAGVAVAAGVGLSIRDDCDD